MYINLNTRSFVEEFLLIVWDSVLQELKRQYSLTSICFTLQHDYMYWCLNGHTLYCTESHIFKHLTKLFALKVTVILTFDLMTLIYMRVKSWYWQTFKPILKSKVKNIVQLCALNNWKTFGPTVFKLGRVVGHA